MPASAGDVGLVGPVGRGRNKILTVSFYDMKPQDKKLSVGVPYFSRLWRVSGVAPNWL
jgi:hypothetical protein